jgi:transcriptional regulator with XRE-family HTH domain
MGRELRLAIAKKVKRDMHDNGHSQDFLAEYLHLSHVSINKRLQGRIDFKATEIKEIATLYKRDANYYLD